MEPNNKNEVVLPPIDLLAAVSIAQRKRAQYPWNDWGRRIEYDALCASGAVVIDAWADPAFFHIRRDEATGQSKGLWLRVEIWRHPDGTVYRTVLDANNTVIIAPLECCRRPDLDGEPAVTHVSPEPPMTAQNNGRRGLP